MAKDCEAGDTRTLGYKLTLDLAAAPLRVVSPPKPMRKTDATRLEEGALQVSGQLHWRVRVQFLPFTHSMTNSKLRRQHFQMQPENPGTPEGQGGCFFFANITAIPAYKRGGKGSRALESPILVAPDFFCFCTKPDSYGKTFCPPLHRYKATDPGKQS